jgi:methylglutaconyl-CoA hydratase
METYVKSENHKGILTIEFYSEQSNSMPAKLLSQLAQEIHAAGNNTDVNVIILRSAGNGAFCAGANFTELKQIKTADEGKQFFSGFANVINDMRKCPKLIIGRIHGKCVGGGVGLAAACDYAIATEAAQIKLSELTIGIGPFVIGPALERKIGLSAFSQLAIDAHNWRSADWARRKGLFAELHTSTENMDESIFKLSNNLLQTSPQAMAQLKTILWQGTQNWDSVLAERAALSGNLIVNENNKKG